MKRFIFSIFIAMLLYVAPVFSQNSISEMRRKAGDLQAQISEKESILLSSKKDVASKLQDVELLSAQIKERKGLIDVLRGEVALLDKEITRLDIEVRVKEEKVEKSRSEYASALRRMRRNGSFQDKLLFIVSASDFNTMLRRYRYTREYMNAHHKLGNDLKLQLDTLKVKRLHLDSARNEKALSLKLQNEQKNTLERLETEQRRLISELQRESRKVEKELKKQQKQLKALNDEIELAIEREIEKRKKAELAARKRKEQGKNEGQSSRVPKDDIKENSEEIRKMSGSFADNKGKMPVPITGPYHLVSSFGAQRGVSGKGNVMIDYGGITLQGKTGARARCIFDGKVTSVVRSDDFAFVIVRHGSYLTVYCRLSNICVKEGDKVKAGDILGDIATDASGHTRILFQLRKEKTKLNPAQWLKL